MKQKFQVKAKSHPKHAFIPMALFNSEVLCYPWISCLGSWQPRPLMLFQLSVYYRSMMETIEAMPSPVLHACPPACQARKKRGGVCFPCTHCHFFPRVALPARTKVKPWKEDADQPAVLLQFEEGLAIKHGSCHPHIPSQNKAALAGTPAKLFSTPKCWKRSPFPSRKILYRRPLNSWS